MAKAARSALAKFEADFTKRFGADALVRPVTPQVVSTGSLTLDHAMGCGGYVVGRITEIWGPAGASKTTLSLIAAANFQAKFPDKAVAWINMERTFELAWAITHHVDPDRIAVMDPENSEDVADMAKMAIASGLFSLVVLDSVGGMVTEEEFDKAAEKETVGTAAKVITRMVKIAAVLCDRTDTTLIIVNQPRANLDRFGADTKPAGPFALMHASTHKIKVRRTKTEGYIIGTETYGFEVSATVEANKVGPSRRTAVFGLFVQPSDKFGPVGIDRASEAFTIGTRYAVIEEPSSGYFILPGSKTKIHGRDNVIDMLRAEPTALEAVRTGLLTHLTDILPPDPEPEGLDFARGADEITPVDLETLQANEAAVRARAGL
jgi:recombination protein RecA